MDDGLLSAVSEVMDRLRKLAAEDARLRVRLQQIGQALIHIGDPHPGDPSLAAARPESPTDNHTHDPIPFSPNGNGFHSHDEFGSRGRFEFSDEIDLAALEQRCRLKAEAARYAADRRRLHLLRPGQREENEPRHQELVTKAKSLPDCFLWMCHPDGPEPGNGASYEDTAGCFDAVADAVALNRTAMESPEVSRATLEKALYLLAEAQSALRSAVNRFDGYADPDQTRAFRWLRAKAAETQIYIRRYMRAGDPADPAKWADLSSRIESIDTEVQDAGRKTRLRRKLVGRVRHKASLIAELPPGETREVWIEMSRIIDELITLGTSPGDPELREHLSPVQDRAPDLDSFPFPAGFKIVIREMARLAQARPSSNGREHAPEPDAGAVGAGVGVGWLTGRAVVLIGGECRPGDHQALIAALGLADLFWIETREPSPAIRFEHYVARDEVALVLLSREWIGESDSELSECCRRHGKPLVRLAEGYDPERVMSRIVEECSPAERLA